MPMQPSPIAETCNPWPNVRVCMSISLSGCLSVRVQRAVPVGGGHAAVYKDVAAGDEGAGLGHQELRHCSDLVGGAGPAGWASLDHLAVALSPWAGQLVPRQRG